MVVVPAERIAEYVSKGWWGERTLAGLFIATAQRQPDAFAVADPPNRPRLTGEAARRCTWGELLADVGRMAAFLHGQGLRKDDVVVVQLPNCVELHALYLACAALGVVISPVPMQYRAHENAHVVATTRARMAITTARCGNHAPAAHWAQLAPQLPGLEQLWAFGAGLPATARALDVGLAGAPVWTAGQLQAQSASVGVSAHDVVTVCWTSGTEAQPKGVPRNHNEWLIVGQSVVDAGQLQTGAQMLIPFPFVNMAGVSTSLAAWLLVGGGLHHHHPFDLDVFVAQLREHPTDYTVAAPAVLNMLLKEPGHLAGVDLARLRRVGSGGGPLADWVVEEFAQRFGIEVVNYFGSNEGAALSSTPQDVPDRTQRSRYFPRFGVPGFEWSASNARKVRTRLVDLDTGEDIQQPGHAGELRFSGPTIFSGYFNAPELTARAFDAQGYYRTGDLFEIAGERSQFYRFCGRHKDIVVRGGMNISSEEVECLLLAHPKVREAAVIGVPDALLGERVCAVIAPQAGATVSLPELVDFLHRVEQVAAFKWPELLVLVDSLPRNPMGKVLKRELRRLHGMPADAAAAPAAGVPA